MSAAAPCAETHLLGRGAPIRNSGAVVLRYALSAAGPVCISAAHFIAALLFLHAFDRADFGLFSFLLVIVPFCLSIAGAIVGLPAVFAFRNGSVGAVALATYLKANFAFGMVAGAAVSALMLSSGAGWQFACISGAYAGAMTLRGFARMLTYTRGPAQRVLVSDVLYSATLVAALFLERYFHQLTPLSAVVTLFGSCFLAWLGFGRTYLREQIVAAVSGSLAGYGRVWNELARWSGLGVVLTELTVNAHAYLVTFIAGPAAFAPLAVGTLLMRPVQLVLAAIPDRERPSMARLLGSGNYAGARRSVHHFRLAAGAVWLLTAASAAAILLWFPQVILGKGYEPSQALIVLGFFAAITAVRSFRTPEAVLLQSAGQFRALAFAGLWSSIASLAATFVLLLLAGPVCSLAGILAGEFVIAVRIRLVARGWMRSHA